MTPGPLPCGAKGYLASGTGDCPRDVVEAEGFTHFGDRRRRLELFLREYGGDLTADGLLDVLRQRLQESIDAMRMTARSGDVTYQRMLDHSVDLRLVRALEGLDEV